MPAPGLDPSWVAALNLAGTYHLHFGSDLIFTYGPLGFLDDPLGLSPHLAIMAFSFQACAVALLWLSLRSAVNRVLGAHVACLLASVTTSLVFRTVPSSTALLATAVYFGTRYLSSARSTNRLTSTIPYALPLAAGLLLYVKFSDGVAMLAIAAVVVAFGSAPGRLYRCGIALVSFATTALAFWFLSQHSIAGLGPWIVGSVRVAAGYSDAMSKGYRGDAQSLTAAAILAILLTVLMVRSTSWRIGSLRARSGTLLLLGTAVLYGLKAGFIRADEVVHRPQYFVLLTPLAIRLVTALPVSSLRVRRLVVVVATAMLTATTEPVITHLNVVEDTQAFANCFRAAFDGPYRNSLEAAARRADRESYAVPQRIAQAIANSPVAIDPWEVTAAWAYRLRWRPAPVFQIYSSYTSSLDSAEARFLVRAPADQYVLRQRYVGVPPISSDSPEAQTIFSAPAIDGHNPSWESPRYQLALYCNYDAVDSSPTWMLFQKGANRCGRATRIGTVSVVPSRPVAVPRASSNEIVVMSFHEAVGVRARLETLLFRPTHRLHASCDDSLFRLPSGAADGPLIVAGTDAGREAVTSCASVTFDSPGTLMFEAIPVY